MGRGKRREYVDYQEDLKTVNGSPVSEGIMTPRKRTGQIIDTPFLRVRQKPSKMADVIAVLQCNDEVEILDDAENRFYKIQLEDDKIGYILSKYCKEVG